MRAQEIMTREPACCTAGDTAQRAAELMQEHDCGAIPVVEDGGGRRVVGMVTDRDIALRAVGRGRNGDTKVGDIMSSEPKCCGAEDDVSDVAAVMKSSQVRRVPIIDAAGTLVGIIAQADLALQDRAADDREVGEVVEQISRPGDRVRPAQGD